MPLAKARLVAVARAAFCSVLTNGVQLWSASDRCRAGAPLLRPSRLAPRGRALRPLARQRRRLRPRAAASVGAPASSTAAAAPAPAAAAGGFSFGAPGTAPAARGAPGHARGGPPGDLAHRRLLGRAGVRRPGPPRPRRRRRRGTPRPRPRVASFGAPASRAAPAPPPRLLPCWGGRLGRPRPAPARPRPAAQGGLRRCRRAGASSRRRLFGARRPRRPRGTDAVAVCRTRAARAVIRCRRPPLPNAPHFGAAAPQQQPQQAVPAPPAARRNKSVEEIAQGWKASLRRTSRSSRSDGAIARVGERDPRVAAGNRGGPAHAAEISGREQRRRRCWTGGAYQDDLDTDLDAMERHVDDLFAERGVPADADVERSSHD